MKFCSICNSKMNRIIKDGSIFYECECKNTVDAEDDELCVLDENFVDEDNVDKYTEIIKNVIEIFTEVTCENTEIKSTESNT